MTTVGSTKAMTTTPVTMTIKTRILVSIMPGTVTRRVMAKRHVLQETEARTRTKTKAQGKTQIRATPTATTTATKATRRRTIILNHHPFKVRRRKACRKLRCRQVCRFAQGFRNSRSRTVEMQILYVLYFTCKVSVKRALGILGIGISEYEDVE